MQAFIDLIVEERVLPRRFTPSLRLNVTYGRRNVEFNDSLTKEQVSKCPAISFDSTSTSDSKKAAKKHMALLLDIDGLKKPWVHSIVGFNGGESQLLQYQAPFPEQGSTHRYVWLLLAEDESQGSPTKDLVVSKTVRKTRSYFDVEEMMIKNRMVPVGITMFRVA